MSKHASTAVRANELHKHRARRLILAFVLPCTWFAFFDKAARICTMFPDADDTAALAVYMIEGRLSERLAEGLLSLSPGRGGRPLDMYQST